MESGNLTGGVKADWYTGLMLGKLEQADQVDEENNAVEENKTDNFKSIEYLRNYDAEQASIRSTNYNDTSMLKVPLLGRIHYVFDIQGFMQIGFIIFYWVYGSFTTLFVVLMPMYNDGKIPLPLLFFYVYVSVCCIISLFRANTMNPGRVTDNILQRSSGDREYCDRCMSERPSGAHHCRRCRHCVVKMDHHCPWINNCVGDENQYLFILLLFYAVLLSVSTLAISLMFFYYFPECQSCDKESFLVHHRIGLVRGALVMGVLMTGFAGTLLVLQYVNLRFEMTSIDWMRLQADLQKHFDIKKLPKAKKSGIRGLEVAFGKGPSLLWILPCRKRGPRVAPYVQEIV